MLSKYSSKILQISLFFILLQLIDKYFAKEHMYTQANTHMCTDMENTSFNTLQSFFCSE